MYSSTEILSKINTYLECLPCDRRPQSLYEPVKYVLSIGGKRVRPVLMLMSYNLYKEDVDNILSSAAAIETYHNYTLLHDDLMDDSDVRRGYPTVHKRWSPNKAILSGDAMLVLAFKMMQQNSNNLHSVLDCFTETALEIGEGQEYDMEFETRETVTEAEYIEMIRLKTSVLLACALQSGALIADAPAASADLHTFRCGAFRHVPCGRLRGHLRFPLLLARMAAVHYCHVHFPRPAAGVFRLQAH